MTNMEAIWDALRQRLEDETESFSPDIARREKPWGLEQLPAIEVWDNGPEVDVGEPGDPQPRWSLSGEIVILAKTNDTDAAPTTQLNDLIYEVRSALERKNTDPVPAGGDGTSYWTDLGIAGVEASVGRVEKGSTGEKTGIGMARIEVTITTY